MDKDHNKGEDGATTAWDEAELNDIIMCLLKVSTEYADGKINLHTATTMLRTTANLDESSAKSMLLKLERDNITPIRKNNRQ